MCFKTEVVFFCIGNQMAILNLVSLQFDVIMQMSWKVAFCIASMF